MEVCVGGDTDMLARVGPGDIVPGTIILDRQGELIGRMMGEAREEDIRSHVNWLLHGHDGAPSERLRSDTEKPNWPWQATSKEAKRL
jgi:hypothetical protein